MNVIEKKIAILVANHFEQAEFEGPLHDLTEAGAEVTVITTGKKKDLQSLQHVKLGSTFKANLLITETRPDDYNALVLPGGVVNADQLRMDAKAQEWVRSYMESDKLIAAICHAPWLLVSAKVVKGRQLTSYFTLQDDIRNAGAKWVDQAIVLDRNLLTSRKPEDLPAFNQAIRAWFGLDSQSPLSVPV